MPDRITFNTRDFERGIADWVRGVEQEATRAMTRIGVMVQNGARRLCPVDTGRLRASIVFVVGRDAVGVFVIIGTNVTYGAFVEYGTMRMAAQPFLRPAFQEARRALTR